jgi:hypothetical protein
VLSRVSMVDRVSRYVGKNGNRACRCWRDETIRDESDAKDEDEMASHRRYRGD